MTPSTPWNGELVSAGVMTEEQAAAVRAEARELAAAAAEEALAAPRPDPTTVTDNVVRLPSLPEVEPDPAPATAGRGTGRDGRGDPPDLARAAGRRRAHPRVRRGRGRRR